MTCPNCSDVEMNEHDCHAGEFTCGECGYHEAR